VQLIAAEALSAKFECAFGGVFKVGQLNDMRKLEPGNQGLAVDSEL